MLAGIVSSLPVNSNYHSAALKPVLACNPLLHNIDDHPDHGDCYICHELGRYSTRKVEQSLPPTFSFRNSCLRFCRLGVPTDKSRVFAIARSSKRRARIAPEWRPAPKTGDANRGAGPRSLVHFPEVRPV